MLGFLKKMLRNGRSAPDHSRTSEAPAVQSAPPPRFSTATPQHEQLRKPVGTHTGRGIEIPVQNILATLPLEVQPKVRIQEVGDLTITVPLEKVLAQLSRGAVKISFGELRQAVPEVFTPENDRDRVLISLPLGDILSRLSPNLITRRRAQRQVQVPEEIASPFSGRGEGLSLGANARGEAPAAPSAVNNRQTAVPVAPVAPATHASAAPAPAPVRSTLTSAPTPAAPSLSHEQPVPAPIKPAAPKRVVPAAPVSQAQAKTEFFAKSAASHQTSDTDSIKRGSIPMSRPVDRTKLTPPPPPFAPAPDNGDFGLTTEEPEAAALPTPAMSVNSHSAAPVPAPRPAPQRPSKPQLQAVPPIPPLPAPTPVQTPAAQLAPAPKPASSEDCLVLALSSLADAWPDAVRKEIVELNIVEAKIHLPVSVLEQALKQGRIAFTWHMLRSWIRPAVLPAVSAHDNNVLELPLKVVAPPFLARQRAAAAAKPQNKVQVDEDIPNLFFGFPQPENGVPVAQATARPSDTNFYVWEEVGDRAKVDESATKRGPTPGTKFVAKYATPNEVVSRASVLDGVAGVLIALPDGLMVANRLPPDVNADTMAAFLPQIFGKVSQCTKELRMGDLNNLNFTVGNVPWKIFRVNAIFFAAFGRAGEPLPTAQLAALAAELDHKPK